MARNEDIKKNGRKRHFPFATPVNLAAQYGLSENGVSLQNSLPDYLTQSEIVGIATTFSEIERSTHDSNVHN